MKLSGEVQGDGAGHSGFFGIAGVVFIVDLAVGADWYMAVSVEIRAGAGYAGAGAHGIRDAISMSE